MLYSWAQWHMEIQHMCICGPVPLLTPDLEVICRPAQRSHLSGLQFPWWSPTRTSFVLYHIRCASLRFHANKGLLNTAFVLWHVECHWHMCSKHCCSVSEPQEPELALQRLQGHFGSYGWLQHLGPKMKDLMVPFAGLVYLCVCVCVCWLNHMSLILWTKVFFIFFILGLVMPLFILYLWLCQACLCSFCIVFFLLFFVFLYAFLNKLTHSRIQNDPVTSLQWYLIRQSPAQFYQSYWQILGLRVGAKTSTL